MEQEGLSIAISLLVAGEQLQELSIQSCTANRAGHAGNRQHLTLCYLSALSYKHLKFWFKAFARGDFCKSPSSAGELR